MLFRSEGQALHAVHYVGIDPTIRGWIEETGNYFAPVGIGEVVRANGKTERATSSEVIE